MGENGSFMLTNHDIQIWDWLWHLSVFLVRWMHGLSSGLFLWCKCTCPALWALCPWIPLLFACHTSQPHWQQHRSSLSTRGILSAGSQNWYWSELPNDSPVQWKHCTAPNILKRFRNGRMTRKLTNFLAVHYRWLFSRLLLCLGF